MSGRRAQKRILKPQLKADTVLSDGVNANVMIENKMNTWQMKIEARRRLSL